MTKQIVHLVFPQNLIQEPVIYTISKKFRVIPNIRRAKITESMGEVTLALEGTEENLEKSRDYLETLGIKVEPVIGDIVE